MRCISWRVHQRTNTLPLAFTLTLLTYAFSAEIIPFLSPVSLLLFKLPDRWASTLLARAVQENIIFKGTLLHQYSTADGAAGSPVLS